MTIKNIDFHTLPIKILTASAFGAVYWYFLETIQPDIVNQIYNCKDCERCANILFDREQLVLAFCAGLSVLAVSLLTIKGWSGILKIIFVPVLCFQVFTAITLWNIVTAQECTALRRERGFPVFVLIILLIELPITAAIWSSFCSAVLLIYHGILKVVFERDKDEFHKLDLDEI